MAKNPHSTRNPAQPIPPAASIPSLSFRRFFSNKSATPHPPYLMKPHFQPLQIT
jgi:hypothetical protein